MSYRCLTDSIASQHNYQEGGQVPSQHSKLMRKSRSKGQVPPSSYAENKEEKEAEA
jgi:hypothetical protein